MKRLQVVDVGLGFWKGCEGVVVDKVPLLPIYRVYVGDNNVGSLPQYAYLFHNVAGHRWMFGFQLKSRPTENEVNRVDLVREGIRFLYDHYHLALNMENKRVRESISHKTFGGK